jgi:hypothetical protein
MARGTTYAIWDLSHAGMSKASVIENEVGLGDIWARRDEYHGYADY